ncbi:hypothetical protein CYY_001170 [Polysphondylium violaceum]|uniref:Uncharacterized protein n=1 Tax=Polysphondylium violaceum TaxID=133409 RepID=A0A8J4V879_9MYCE|nr:hypothetical protein CYY_001170 [Polysphondylium violaceum]
MFFQYLPQHIKEQKQPKEDDIDVSQHTNIHKQIENLLYQYIDNSNSNSSKNTTTSTENYNQSKLAIDGLYNTLIDTSSFDTELLFKKIQHLFWTNDSVANYVLDSIVIQEDESSQSGSLRKQLLSLFVSGPWLIEYFYNDAERVKRWFGHFALREKDIKFGSKALESFLFNNRENSWDRCCKWVGGQSYPPCVVVQKKELFMQLDIVKTIHSIIDCYPLFFSSIELHNTIYDNIDAFISIDRDAVLDSIKSKKAMKKQRLHIDAILESLCTAKENQKHLKSILHQLVILLLDKGKIDFFKNLFILNDVDNQSNSNSYNEQSFHRVFLSICKWKDYKEMMVYSLLLPTFINKMTLDDQCINYNNNINNREVFKSYIESKDTTSFVKSFLIESFQYYIYLKGLDTSLYQDLFQLLDIQFKLKQENQFIKGDSDSEDEEELYSFRKRKRSSKKKKSKQNKKFKELFADQEDLNYGGSTAQEQQLWVVFADNGNIELFDKDIPRYIYEFSFLKIFNFYFK